MTNASTAYTLHVLCGVSKSHCPHFEHTNVCKFQPSAYKKQTTDLYSSLAQLGSGAVVLCFIAAYSLRPRSLPAVYRNVISRGSMLPTGSNQAILHLLQTGAYSLRKITATSVDR
jgi:hypothetical protein